MKLTAAKTLLQQSIKALTDCKDYFTTKPLKDFSRPGKLPFEPMIQSILCMGAGSLSNEMMDFFGYGEELATTSAFVQKRAKILPEAFEYLFAHFTKKFEESITYRGFQLLAVDGSDFLTAANPKDPESYFPGTEGQKPYNLLHLNALYDVVRHVYVDAFLQKRRCADECGALVIETSFRDLKYTVGLQHFHAKKTEFVQQEIFARLTMYNFYELITQSVVIQQKSRKYPYKVNFSAAVHICREFFLRDLAPSRVEALLTKFISPVRPGRSSPRKLKNKHPFGFTYRVA